eukprot:3506729-Rhodomonas_salina.1
MQTIGVLDLTSVKANAKPRHNVPELRRIVCAQSVQTKHTCKPDGVCVCGGFVCSAVSCRRHSRLELLDLPCPPHTFKAVQFTNNKYQHSVNVGLGGCFSL